MVRLKGAGNQPPQPVGELSHVELDLQAHRETAEAKFSEIQSSFESFCSQQSQFRTDILEELR